MKFINKFFINAGLFSVLSLLLLIPVLAVTMASFNTRMVENAEVLSAQDESISTEQELYNDVPVELEEIIRKVETEMAKQATENQVAEPQETTGYSGTAESPATDALEIGN
ncbi:hypothetical protein A2473_01510 [candidate division WWE3 bacterium RIFOXYC2_FULL_42_13]|uniref:Uncharacterized protein n=1 Tax=candidate division WWE3 bacterium TaxID=2053526 RepID=A0A3D0ZRK8_UNCKA|nr:MAG: hypothetical protein A2245_01775 [candidate division WWE3 bacterium RIFOXYA2_FULL_43_12]OGC66801.1 MAG: hypothetical protein A2274_01325 [candidate division WWE3 bacterium RIFOXYA12_FULL_43_11]OGC73680.1 MAG: hypothetical protein A2473_01510 [candidate division WWE3 bacterium RIFOXYC2_FULL_42_13]OGC75196.1 MAG: hypothetical protein A2547_02155 [candidate division WWE3 bacterium RIFOXYD2_FULL_43_10]HBY10253.1 hypothetical protein [candidate division WWE3 bacterium]